MSIRWVTLVCIDSSNRAMQLRPFAFARWVAMSARRRNSSGVIVRFLGTTAKPMLEVTNTETPSTTNGSLRAAWIDSARAKAWAGRSGVAIEDHELVAGRPGDVRADVARQPAEAGTELAQHLVGELVSEAVVDVLEAVEVDLHQRRARLGPPRVVEHLADGRDQLDPVRKAGELVDLAPREQLVLGPIADADRVQQPQRARTDEQHGQRRAHDPVERRLTRHRGDERDRERASNSRGP